MVRREGGEDVTAAGYCVKQLVGWRVGSAWLVSWGNAVRCTHKWVLGGVVWLLCVIRSKRWSDARLLRWPPVNLSSCLSCRQYHALCVLAVPSHGDSAGKVLQGDCWCKVDQGVCVCSRACV